MPSAKRRSRMRRCSFGKRLELTERDFEIFRLLSRYRYLRANIIHAFVGGVSKTRFVERLGDLFHEGFIDRPEQQWALADCRHTPLVYEAGKGGIRAMETQGLAVGATATFLGPRAHRQYAHSLMICDVLASIELGARQSSGLRFIAWPEMLDRAPESTRTSPVPFRIPVPGGGLMIPDGLFGIEYAFGSIKSYRFFALEADRGTMPVRRSDQAQTSLLAKLDSYRAIVSQQRHKAYWGIPNLLVLTVTMGGERLSRIIREMAGPGRDNAVFLFKARTAAELASPAPSILAGPWERAGLPAMAIDR